MLGGHGVLRVSYHHSVPRYTSHMACPMGDQRSAHDQEVGAVYPGVVPGCCPAGTSGRPRHQHLRLPGTLSGPAAREL